MVPTLTPAESAALRSAAYQSQLRCGDSKIHLVREMRVLRQKHACKTHGERRAITSQIRSRRMACRSRPQFETRQLLKRRLNVGLGFVTGRKSSKNVSRTYLGSWNETQKSTPAQNVALHLLVAYDLAYTNTEIADYAVTDDEAVRAVASSRYISDASIRTETQDLVRRQVLTLS